MRWWYTTICVRRLLLSSQIVETWFCDGVFYVMLRGVIASEQTILYAQRQTTTRNDQLNYDVNALVYTHVMRREQRATSARKAATKARIRRARPARNSPSRVWYIRAFSSLTSEVPSGERVIAIHTCATHKHSHHARHPPHVYHKQKKKYIYKRHKTYIWNTHTYILFAERHSH